MHAAIPSAPQLTTRTMPTITPATPPMKPASFAICATSMELTACTAVAFLRCTLVDRRTAANCWPTVGLLQHTKRCKELVVRGAAQH